jgi:AcrR family transcriptional regulator
MPYRRTENVARKLAARRDAIIAAAAAVAGERGIEAVQILAVAERAGIAAGTVYRYFPAKSDLVASLVAGISEREIGAVRWAADAAPGPLSALSAAVATFAARALRNRRLAWAMIAEPADADMEAVRLTYRQALAREFETRVARAVAGGHLPAQDSALAASALVGILLEGLIGPLAPEGIRDSGRAHIAVQTLTLFALRALGVVDARARGLVVQTALPAASEGAP